MMRPECVQVRSVGHLQSVYNQVGLRTLPASTHCRSQAMGCQAQMLQDILSCFARVTHICHTAVSLSQLLHLTSKHALQVHSLLYAAAHHQSAELQNRPVLEEPQDQPHTALCLEVAAMA